MEYIPKMVMKRITVKIRNIKTVFDPHNGLLRLMNCLTNPLFRQFLLRRYWLR